MTIQNYGRCYRVLRYLDGTEDTVEYLCRESGGGREEDFLLVCVREPVLAKRFMLFLEEKVQRDEFTDYRECFQADGQFYAVFCYSGEQPLEEKLSGENVSLLERAMIVRSLLERLLLQNLPPYFAESCLDPERITVSRSLETGWNYHLEALRKFDEPDPDGAARCLARTFQLLFFAELDKMLYPRLNQYVEGLERGEFSSYMEMYRSFLAVSEAILQGQAEERIPQTFWFRLWESVKKGLNFLKKTLMALLLVAAALYAVWVIRDDSGSRAGEPVMKQIGDLVIEQQEEQSGEGR